MSKSQLSQEASTGNDSHVLDVSELEVEHLHSHFVVLVLHEAERQVHRLLQHRVALCKKTIEWKATTGCWKRCKHAPCRMVEADICGLDGSMPLTILMEKRDEIETTRSKLRTHGDLGDDTISMSCVPSVFTRPATFTARDRIGAG